MSSEPSALSWPDQRPVATSRQTLVALALALAVAFIALPFGVDLLGGWPWQALWVMCAFGVGFLGQAGMDTARPDPHDRFAVWTYRLTYLLLPAAPVLLVLLLGDPSASVPLG